MKFRSVNNEKFKSYGCVHPPNDFYDVYKNLKYQTPVKDEVVYVAREKLLEAEVLQISNKYFGEMPIQIGFCNGKNKQVDALEYHKTSEIIVAGTDLILVLGSRADIDKHGYDISKADAFYMKEGEVVEIYGPTLHYCPIMTDNSGFKAAIILPMLTNTSKSKEHVFAKNKWLYAHPDSNEANGDIAGYLRGELLILD